MPSRPVSFHNLYSIFFNFLVISNNQIGNITTFDRTIKISNQADDTVIITNGSQGSINEVLSVSNMFSQVFGLNVNLEKSYIFPVGLLFSKRQSYKLFLQVVNSYMQSPLLLNKNAETSEAFLTVPS